MSERNIAMKQLDIFSGMVARDAGISQAVSHADAVIEGWSGKAYELLKSFLSLHPGEFMAEDVRRFAGIKGFDEPPHLRAWGSVMMRAAKSGLIRKVGFGQVSNPKAHMANAAVWTHNVAFNPNDNNQTKEAA